jgi:soluble lytic murein transglycosylase
MLTLAASAKAGNTCPAQSRPQVLRDHPEQLEPCAKSADSVDRIWAAHGFAATGRFAEAAALLVEAAPREKSPLLKAVLQLSAAYDEARAGDAAAGLKQLGSIKAPRRWLQAEVAAARADLSLMTGAWSDAERAARQALDLDHPTPDALRLLLVRVAAERHDAAAFTRTLNDLEVMYPGSDAARAGERLVSATLPPPQFAASELADRWRNWIARGGAQAVADECLARIKTLPPNAGVARFQCGAALATVKNPAAEEVMKQAADALAGQPLQARALLTYARLQGHGTDAGRVAAVCPLIKPRGTGEAADCAFLVAFLLQQSGNRGDAQRAFDQVREEFPHTARAHDAAWFQAFDAFRHDPKSAVARFDAMLKSGLSGDDRAQALYWRGRARLDSQPDLARADWSEVLRSDPFGYYGWLAASRLGVQTGDVPSSACGTAEQPSQAAVPLAAVDASRLLAAGFVRYAAIELRGSLPRTRRDSMTWTPFLASVGQFERIVTIGVGLGGQGGPWPIPREKLPIVQAAFPRAFTAALEQAPPNVDRCLLLSLMRRESRFNPDAISQAQARGLLQLLPTTAASVAKEFGQEAPSADHLHDPDVNLRIAGQYVQRLMERFGHPLLAAAAYNGGPKAVARWTQELNGAQIDEWVERIPFRETRNYVKAVGGAYASYALIYGGHRPALSWDPIQAAPAKGIDY